MPWVVESPALDGVTGVRKGTARVWVKTEDRARSLAEETEERSYRYVTEEEMHPQARENMARAL
jgi:hypothetical protein